MTGSIKAILLDKDGTLVDFQSYWIPVTEVLIDRLVLHLDLDGEPAEHRQRLLGSIGIVDGRIRSDSPVATGTGREISAALAEQLPRTDAGTVGRFMKEEYLRLEPTFRARMTAYPGANRTLERLSGAGYTLGVATADSTGSATYALQILGIDHLFRFVGGSDLVSHRKPHPELAELFCREVGVSGGEFAMVGDTPADMAFARNAGAGAAVAVLTGVGSREELAPLADHVLDSVADLDQLFPAPG